MQAVETQNIPRKSDTVFLCEDYNQSMFYGKITFLSHAEHNRFPLKISTGEFCIGNNGCLLL